MKKVLSTVLAAAMTVGLAGCGSSSSSSDEKVFTMASELDIAGLDSSVVTDGTSFTAIGLMVEGLMGVNEDGEIVPAAADSVSTSDDGLVYTYHLREASWSNGTPVTADDFVYGWQRIIANSGDYAYLYGSDGAAILNADALMGKQADGETLTQADLDTLGIKAIDDQTVEITLEKTCSFFDQLMSFYVFYPINRAYAEEVGDQYAKTADTMISNGAFTIDSWDLGSKAVFEKNEEYWNADAVNLDEFVMTLVQDPQTSATNFDSGYNDWATINSSLVDKYRDTPEFNAYSSGFLFYLSLNFEDQNIQNYNIRKALSLAIDRTDFAENILNDGSTEADGFIPTTLCADPDGVDFRERAEDFTTYDMTAAQEALDAGLAELGVEEITLTLLYGTDESPMEQEATYLQNAFTQLDGLNIEMVATTKKDRLNNKMPNGEYSVALTRWGPDYADATTYLNLLISTNTARSGHYANAEYDAMMESVQTESDVATRFDEMVAAEKIAMDDIAVIPVFEKGSALLIRETVSNYVYRSVGGFTYTYIDIE